MRAFTDRGKSENKPFRCHHRRSFVQASCADPQGDRLLISGLNRKCLAWERLALLRGPWRCEARGASWCLRRAEARGGSARTRPAAEPGVPSRSRWARRPEEPLGAHARRRKCPGCRRVEQRGRLGLRRSHGALLGCGRTQDPACSPLSVGFSKSARVFLWRPRKMKAIPPQG